MRNWTNCSVGQVETQSACKCCRMGLLDSMSVLSGVSEHWEFHQAFYMEGSAEVEKLEFFGTSFRRQVLHQN